MLSTPGLAAAGETKSAKPPLAEGIDFHLERMIPVILHTMFVDLWFFWPFIIGVVLLRVLVDRLCDRIDRRKRNR